MTLTIAETLGATTGLGYFVKRFISYGDFTSVMAAIILMAATVTVLNLLLTLLKKKTVNWVK
jgi:NitT/TauT family transport system permease protein